VKTALTFFPFDLFGSAGTAAGVELLADACREMLADNRREKVPTRATSYMPHVRIREHTFETLDQLNDWRRRGRQSVRQSFDRGDFLLWVTGNHLGTLPVYDELSGRDDTLVIQFDAHLDVYNLSDCTTELSHGNFLLHCDGPLPQIINVGARELLLQPEYLGQYYRSVISTAALAVDEEGTLDRVRKECGRAARVFIDLDCDVFDPAYFPALAHPLPFGISPTQFLRFLDATWTENVVGVSIAEFDPARDVRDQSLSTLVWLFEYLLLRRYEKG
jgi:arginase family enzyme